MATPNQHEFTVGQYSDIVVRRYLHGAFSSDAQDNLTIAAQELYELLKKLMNATGSKSDDAKAPLKAIRNAIDTICSSSSEGPSAPEISSLFDLYTKLQDICQSNITKNIDAHHAVMVQDVLRYRLTRLVTGDSWDDYPEMKLRLMKLIFSFMVRENARLQEEAKEVPNLKLGTSRAISLGRARSRDLGPQRESKWAESFAEMGRVPGQKLVVLLKMMLHADLSRYSHEEKEDARHEEDSSNGCASSLPTPDGKEADLLDLYATPAGNVVGASLSFCDDKSIKDPGHVAASRQSSLPSSSSTPSTAPAHKKGTINATSDDRNSDLYEQFQYMSVAPSCISDGKYASTHPGPTERAPSSSDFDALADCQDPFDGRAFIKMNRSGAQQHDITQYYYQHPGMMRANMMMGRAASPYDAVYQQQRQYSGNELFMNNDSQFDAMSPYLGIPHPLNDTRFDDVAPLRRQREQLEEQNAPPMRPAHMSYTAGGNGGGVQGE